ncbi:hypothetical protein AWB76_05293 [Caballeronia temeraria]|uniref:Uncharacterized protein n=1 Tax=Caballeronia temeraria TaxID=1777137 RepID=A0A158CA13_9BURK|nr:hypothetical protein [Caballeronia temeraria]SAK79130.1 hypothetical protein AWB76_05293 [Caballeronia temeraria]
MQRYAVGEWESLWATEPYMKHRFVLDLESRTVIAGEDRVRRHWWSMRLEHVAYMQQLLDETFDSIWDEPEELGFVRQDWIPSWATKAWPWPPLPEVQDVEKMLDGSDLPFERDEHGCIIFPPRFIAGGRK